MGRYVEPPYEDTGVQRCKRCNAAPGVEFLWGDNGCIACSEDDFQEIQGVSKPNWHKQPTCPGRWVSVPDPDDLRLGSNWLVMELTQHDIERGAPLYTTMVYGPLPEIPNAK